MTRRIPVVVMRGGTSRGLNFHADNLPADLTAQDKILAGALGSPDPYGRQVNGLGGATSSTSKAIIVEPDSTGQADVVSRGCRRLQTAWGFWNVCAH